MLLQLSGLRLLLTHPSPKLHPETEVFTTDSRQEKKVTSGKGKRKKMMMSASDHIEEKKRDGRTLP